MDSVFCSHKKIIINHLKPDDCVQTNDYYQTEIAAWNYRIIIIRQEYLKPYNCVQIICIENSYLKL